ncbi:DoxX family protein [Henriciella aquimarina]|uniref:DoxX family protein n=1 Tax=Henriciella aquimarina TaxID=545261 RepID=UPI000A04F919|nr:DoxX family protein [Henriciella aquimarina]
MENLSAELILAWLLAAFFVVGFVVNVPPTEKTRTMFREWGYPAWFHLVAAILELIVAGMLLFAVSRFAGAALGTLIMLAAFATLIRNKEFKHAIAPGVALVLFAVLTWMTLPA